MERVELRLWVSSIQRELGEEEEIELSRLDEEAAAGHGQCSAAEHCDMCPAWVPGECPEGAG